MLHQISKLFTGKMEKKLMQKINNKIFSPSLPAYPSLLWGKSSAFKINLFLQDRDLCFQVEAMEGKGEAYLCCRIIFALSWAKMSISCSNTNKTPTNEIQISHHSFQVLLNTLLAGPVKKTNSCDNMQGSSCIRKFSFHFYKSMYTLSYMGFQQFPI